MADAAKVAAAVARLDEVLPLRIRQHALPDAYRHAHRLLLRAFFETGAPPPELAGAGGEAEDALTRLERAGLIVRGDSGEVTGAYPFTREPREHRVVSRHGEARAMCAIDALGVSPMFDTPVTVHSRCRVGGGEIVLDQSGDGVRVRSGIEPVFAAVNWRARDAAACCADGLCTEMIFIAGTDCLESWKAADPEHREAFDLDEAVAFASALFVPLMGSAQGARSL